MTDFAHSFFDPDGNPISVEEWVKLRADFNARTIAETALSNGVVVRTLWCGLKDPIAGLDVFSTCAGLLGRLQSIRQYTTKEEALAGHGPIVERLTIGTAA